MNAKIPVRSAHIDYEHLYERIKMYRKEKNIKQHEIAIQLGYEPANYGKIERGDTPNEPICAGRNLLDPRSAARRNAKRVSHWRQLERRAPNFL